MNGGPTDIIMAGQHTSSAKELLPSFKYLGRHRPEVSVCTVGFGSSASPVGSLTPTQKEILQSYFNQHFENCIRYFVLTAPPEQRNTRLAVVQAALIERSKAFQEILNQHYPERDPALTHPDLIKQNKWYRNQLTDLNLCINGELDFGLPIYRHVFDKRFVPEFMSKMNVTEKKGLIRDACIQMTQKSLNVIMAENSTMPHLDLSVSAGINQPSYLASTLNPTATIAGTMLPIFPNEAEPPRRSIGMKGKT